TSRPSRSTAGSAAGCAGDLWTDACSTAGGHAARPRGAGLEPDARGSPPDWTAVARRPARRSLTGATSAWWRAGPRAASAVASARNAGPGLCTSCLGSGFRSRRREGARPRRTPCATAASSADRLFLTLPLLFAEQILLDLAGRGARQLAELDPRRTLELGQVL